MPGKNEIPRRPKYETSRENMETARKAMIMREIEKMKKKEEEEMVKQNGGCLQDNIEPEQNVGPLQPIPIDPEDEESSSDEEIIIKSKKGPKKSKGDSEELKILMARLEEMAKDVKKIKKKVKEEEIVQKVVGMGRASLAPVQQAPVNTPTLAPIANDSFIHSSLRNTLRAANGW